MPTYEYVCDDCNYHFEELQSVKAKPITVCPKCRGRVHRLISEGTGLIFKGSGFYITDYARKKSTEPTGEKERPSEKKTEAPAEKKSSD
jgi:putative FmdB family regulatory protein